MNPQPSWNEGLALALTFGILILLSTLRVTSKFALVIGIFFAILVWNNAYQSGQLKTFWNELAQ